MYFVVCSSEYEEIARCGVVNPWPLEVRGVEPLPKNLWKKQSSARGSGPCVSPNFPVVGSRTFWGEPEARVEG